MTTVQLHDPMELAGKRELLEEILTKYDPDQRDVELQIYDIITAVSQTYQDTLKRRNEEIIKKIYDAANNGKTFEQACRIGASPLINLVKEYGHGPAMLVVLNVNDINSNHFYNGNKTNPPVGLNVFSKDAEDALQQLAYKDNATIISPEGIILGTQVFLANLDPAAVENVSDDHPDAVYIKKFKAQAHARHNSARAAAYMMPGTVAWTLSEENGHVYRLGGTKPEYHGRILFSTRSNTQ